MVKGKAQSKVVSTVVNRSKRGMRTRIRGQLGSNTVLQGNELLDKLQVGATYTDTSAFIPLVGGSTQGRTSVIFANIARNFQKFIYEPGTALHYQPAVGLNTAGTIYAAFIDNPELLAEYHSAGTVSRLTAIKTCASMRSYPVWQEFTLPLVATPRQRRFSNDAVVDFNDVDALNRVAQGAYIIGVEGVAANATSAQTIGNLSLTNRLRLEEIAPYKST